MRYVYFTKFLQSLDSAGLLAFCKEVGLDGVDLVVRPGYPVTPGNVRTELPKVAKLFRDAGKIIGLVSTPVNLIDPDNNASKAIFEACGKSSVPAVKIGYFPYRGKFDDDMKQARIKLAGFAKLAAKTGVRCCYHTHSGNMLGNNAAGIRLLLRDLDPHHISVFLDTGHTAINGGPIRMEFDLVRNWLSLIAIKDMLWVQGKTGWQAEVVPAGAGIVRWNEVAMGLKDRKFNGTISLHGEYHTKDFAQRKELAKKELVLLKRILQN